MVPFDPTEFFISFLEYAGYAFIVLSILCIWEFTIGIIWSIKKVFTAFK